MKIVFWEHEKRRNRTRQPDRSIFYMGYIARPIAESMSMFDVLIQFFFNLEFSMFTLSVISSKYCSVFHESASLV
jgi:hypothetical protein